MKAKPRIVCKRCQREAQPVRDIYCKNCATTLVRNGELQKVRRIATPLQLTPYQDQVLTGLMLGDGCLFKYKPNHLPYLIIGRSQSDRAYLYQNFDVFKEFCKSPPHDDSMFDKRTGHIYFRTEFQTRNCKVFDSYYSLWYPDGKKVVPQSIEMTPLAMAIFFCDDGHVAYTEYDKLRIQLSTECFTGQEVSSLKEKIEFACDNELTMTKDRRLHMYGDSAIRFCDVIDQFMPASMSRKTLWRTQSPVANSAIV